MQSGHSGTAGAPGRRGCGRQRQTGPGTQSGLPPGVKSVAINYKVTTNLVEAYVINSLRSSLRQLARSNNQTKLS